MTGGQARHAASTCGIVWEMARAEIMIPKAQAVRFPNRCPVCGKPAPGHATKLEAVFRVLAPVSSELMDRWSPELPVCREHERRLRFARLSDAFALRGLVLASVALLMYLADRFELLAAGWWSWTGVLLAGLIVPQALMSVVARPLFDVEPDDEHVVFCLRNADYAKDFAKLNRDPS